MSFYDILGREIKLGDCVTVDSKVYRITRFTKKMVALEGLNSTSKRAAWRSRELMKYSHDVTLVPEQDVMLWLLKQGNPS